MRLRETIGTFCIVLISTEIIGKFCPKESMLSFVRSLVILMLILSTILSLTNLSFDFSVTEEEVASNQQLTAYVEEQLVEKAEEELRTSLEALLATIGEKPKKLWIETDIQEDSSIELTKVGAEFSFAEEAQRSKILLEQVLGDEIQVEVRVNGR